MFEAHDIREWRGHTVRGADGGKIGEMEAVYVDTRTDMPSFATVKAGVPGRKRLVFVPLDGASVSPGYLTVAYDKGQVKAAPSIDTDGELTFEEEPAVFKHYEMEYESGAAGERRLARR
ncbi:PRC-barrel domain-containing protein [Streptomyces sp. CMB-StM0423]|uniref:PRC-barrel domain-containing protein n=1 Tax=Streptomyces sp. CMB-StM0423 TaxID=2059884 RepID=UPI000C7064D7|nr:PRC-barrel domain-containing protein [Streptomyces sp. CMB-StM0423]AUH42062.1 photosystem reaction center subunit H [Streptomyces sp. CMB-StM0423]